MKTYLNTAETAEYLDFSRKQLEAWRVRGGGPRYAKIGRSVRYRRVDLDAFVEERLVTSTSDEGRAGK